MTFVSAVRNAASCVAVWKLMCDILDVMYRKMGRLGPLRRRDIVYDMQAQHVLSQMRLSVRGARRLWKWLNVSSVLSAAYHFYTFLIQNVDKIEILSGAEYRLSWETGDFGQSQDMFEVTQDKNVVSYGTLI